MADTLACDEIPERSTSSFVGKRKRDEATAHLINERRANAALAVELADKAIDALVALEAMEAAFAVSGEEAEPNESLFAERDERHFLQDAQRVAINIRERALDYVGERPPNSPNC
jgi:galactokinase